MAAVPDGSGDFVPADMPAAGDADTEGQGQAGMPAQFLTTEFALEDGAG
jgi:hypothetical protein